MGTTFQLLSHVLRVWRPPFALYVVAFFFAAAGQALQDTHGNTYVSGVPQAHRWLGFIHAMYMLGCLIGPLAASAVASGSRWNLFYAFPLGLCFINVIVTTYAFWNTVALKRSSTGTPEDVPPAQSTQVSRNKRAVQELRQTIRVPSVWLLSLFFFFFLGVGITAGGKHYHSSPTLILTVQRLGSHIPGRSPQRKSPSHGLRSVRLLRRMLLGQAPSRRAYTQVWRA